MTCPQCGNENPPKLKFCVKCGMNLENPQEVNYEQVDMGNYHSEEEPESAGFKLGSGTFTISDTAPVSTSSSDLYTADELNDTDEEFDFSNIDEDEPFIPKLDAGRLSVPHPQQNQPQGVYGYPQGGMPGMPGMPNQGMPGMPNQGMPNQGMPMYGQPMMYPQPQIVGYDANGMPIYGQPMMYPQPQIVGYDANGMPIYGQPMMYPQPQIVGYDANGMPIYGQPVMYPQQPVPGENVEMMQNPYQQPMGYPGMAPMPGMMPGGMNPYQPQPQQPAPKEERVEVPDDFWEFFDGGKATEHADRDGMDDFFGKHSNDMGGMPGSSDQGRLKRFEHKKVDYMGDTPVVDASGLAPNTPAKYNKLYMRQTAQVNADDLQAKQQSVRYDYMGATKDVNADDLSAYQRRRSDVTMNAAGKADADQLEAYIPEHKEAIMSGEVKAVEALPKKKTTYNDEIDAIQLPEYMQARKTQRDDTPEIPGLPEI